MRPSQRLSRQLHELSSVTPSVERTRRALQAARAVIDESVADSPSKRRSLAKFWPQTSLAVFAGVFAVAGISLIVVGPSSPNIAFAQVIDQVQSVKSVQYVETRSHLPRAGELRGPTEVKKVTVLGRSRGREEIISVTPGEPLPKGEEWSASEVGIVIISDLARGKFITLNPETKVYSVIEQFASISPDDGKITVSKATAEPEADFFKSLQLFPAVKAERLPVREIAGHEVIGFRTTEKTGHKHGVETWTRTYWVDAKSHFPVQVEISIESTDPNVGQSRGVLSDFVFDQPINESLMSTEPPTGYKAD